MRRKLSQGLLLLAATITGLLAPQAGAGVIEERLKPVSLWEHSTTAGATDDFATWEAVDESSLTAAHVPLGNLAEAYGSDIPTSSSSFESQESFSSKSDSEINWMSLALNDKEVNYSSNTTSLRHGLVAVSASVVAPAPVPVPPALALGALGMAAVAGFRRRSSASVA